MKENYDVVILGGGATALSAAIYTTRAMLSTLVLEGLGYGGQLLVTDMVENYPGFPDGIRGPEISNLMEQQARNFGAELRHEQVIGLEDIEKEVKIVRSEKTSYTARSIIIATGGSHKKLGVPGEEEFSGKGVSYCAVCDGNFFRGQDVIVVGGGDSALDEGGYLSGIVNKVTVVHRRDELRASKILQERAFANPNMDFLFSHVVEKFDGKDVMNRVMVRDLKTQEVREHETAAAFIYVGFTPNSEFLKGLLPMDNTGHIFTNIRMETEIPGVFACGDVRVDSDRQLGTGVGDGITAALSAYRYITEQSS